MSFVMILAGRKSLVTGARCHAQGERFLGDLTMFGTLVSLGAGDRLEEAIAQMCSMTSRNSLTTENTFALMEWHTTD